MAISCKVKIIYLIWASSIAVEDEKEWKGKQQDARKHLFRTG